MKRFVQPEKEKAGTCACCGRTSRTIWGYIGTSNQVLAAYYVQWTVGALDHYPNVDLILGRFDDASQPADRFLVSVLFQPGARGGIFTVTDSESRPWNVSTLCSRALKRSAVIGTPLASQVFELVDFVWGEDPRIREVKALNEICQADTGRG